MSTTGKISVLWKESCSQQELRFLREREEQEGFTSPSTTARLCLNVIAGQRRAGKHNSEYSKILKIHHLIIPGIGLGYSLVKT